MGGYLQRVCGTIVIEPTAIILFFAALVLVDPCELWSGERDERDERERERGARPVAAGTASRVAGPLCAGYRSNS